MTRRLLVLTILTGALLFSGVVADSPPPPAAAAVLPASSQAGLEGGGAHVEVRLGDGILQVLVRGCQTCPATISVHIELPDFAAAFIGR